MSDSDAYSGGSFYDDEPSSNGYSDGGGANSDDDPYNEPISSDCGGDGSSDEYNEPIPNDCGGDGNSDDEPIPNGCGDDASDEDEDSYGNDASGEGEGEGEGSYNNPSTYPSYGGGNSGKSYYDEQSSYPSSYHGRSSGTGYADNRIVGYKSQQSQARELTSRVRNEDRETGAYERVTTKEKTSRGVTHFEKSTGRYGVAHGYSNSTTIKVGDKSGYTEYHHEDRVQRVDYEGAGSGRLRPGGNKNTSISVDRRGAGIQKSHTRVSVSHGKNKSASLSVTSRGKRG